MNILPHKSWHVRTKKNIARVRRDEEKAKQEEDEKLRRINLAEHEARIAQLRARNGAADPTETISQVEEPSSSYINLFDNVKDKIGKDGEKETEKRAEQEKWEVKAGIFSYLDGRYKHENTKEEEWYLKPSAERLPSSSKVQDNLKESKLKHQHDPLVDIKRHLAQMKKVQEEPRSSSERLPNPKSKVETEYETKSSILSDSVKAKKSKRGHKSKHKKRKHKSRKRHSSSDSSQSDSDHSSPNVAKEALIHKLRQERLERERKERLRTNILVKGSNPNQISQEVATQDNNQKYNSQFNPHIARQNCDR